MLEKNCLKDPEIAFLVPANVTESLEGEKPNSFLLLNLGGKKISNNYFHMALNSGTTCSIWLKPVDIWTSSPLTGKIQYP